MCGMKRPAAKTRIVRKKPARKPAGANRRAAHGGATLAERIVTAPYLVERQSRRRRAWRNGSPALPAAEAKPLKALLAAHPTVGTLLQSLARKLALSVGAGERRSRHACCACSPAIPTRIWPRCSPKTARAVAATEDEAEAMRLLRRMKAEAALLIALADIGGVWPVMRATRALDRSRRYRGRCRRPFRAGRGRARRSASMPKDKAKPQDGQRLHRAGHGQDGRF